MQGARYNELGHLKVKPNMPSDVKKLSETDQKLLVGDANNPEIYFNGFINGMSQGDIRIGLVLNGKAVGGLNCSYTVAKTLSTKLAELIETLERATGRSIMTIDEIKESLAKAESEETKPE